MAFMRRGWIEVEVESSRGRWWWCHGLLFWLHVMPCHNITNVIRVLYIKSCMYVMYLCNDCMYACMYVCMCAMIVCMHVCVQWLYVCMYVCMCVCVCMYGCMDGWMDGIMDVCNVCNMYICTCGCIDACMYMDVSMHACMFSLHGPARFSSLGIYSSRIYTLRT